jgi:hypothetical protein
LKLGSDGAAVVSCLAFFTSHAASVKYIIYDWEREREREREKEREKKREREKERERERIGEKERERRRERERDREREKERERKRERGEAWDLTAALAIFMCCSASADKVVDEAPKKWGKKRRRWDSLRTFGIESIGCHYVRPLCHFPQESPMTQIYVAKLSIGPPFSDISKFCRAGQI